MFGGFGIRIASFEGYGEEMNEYDHDDAFREANLCAGKLTDIGNAIKSAESKLQAQIILEELKKQYEKYFTAFIEGVDYGRKHPK